jgi:predicted lipoprotein with Yx(FWY)xxD motif
MGRHTTLLTWTFVLLSAAFAWLALDAAASLAQTNTTVQVQQNGTYGAILTTADGKTLYTFSADSGGQSACTGACTQAWPPLTITSSMPTAPQAIAGSVSSIVRSDNQSRQVTFNGQPLYTFARDTAAGQVNGEGVNAFNGTWHVARVSNATPAGTGPTAAPGAMPATGSGGLLGQSGSAAWLLRSVLVGAGALSLLALGVARLVGARNAR